jgi:ribonuclease-3
VEAILAELETALEHRFARPELLVRALTHRSLANEQASQEPAHSERASGERVSGDRVSANGKQEAEGTGDNERLEFLGDAVLGLVVADSLFELHPGWHEGELTRVRSLLVSRKHIAEVAGAIGLGNHLRLSRGEEHSGLRRKTTVLSNTMEAVLGALFLDGGLEPVKAFVRRSVMGATAEQLARELDSGDALGNYKSALQEHMQASRAGAPLYRVKSESGPDHRKRFLVEVRVKTADGEPGKQLARGMGSTKKNAEQDAARRALERLQAAQLKANATSAVQLGAEGEEAAQR